MKRSLFILMNRPIIPKIKTNAFACPSNQKLRSDGSAAHSTQASSLEGKPRPEASQSSISSLLTERINSDRKLKAIISMFTTFEENCIVDKGLSGAKLKELRGHSRRALGIVLEDYDENGLKTHHSDSLGLAMLYYAAVKIGMTRGEFERQASRISRRKNLSIKFIRKGKSYQLMKKVIAKHKKRREQQDRFFSANPTFSFN